MRNHVRLAALSATAMLLTATACSDAPSTVFTPAPVTVRTVATFNTLSGDRTYSITRDGRRTADGRWRVEGAPTIRAVERAPTAAAAAARATGLAELRRTERSLKVTRIRDGQIWRRLAVVPEPGSGLPRTIYQYEGERPVLRQDFTYRKGGRRTELASTRTTVYDLTGAPIATADQVAQAGGLAAGARIGELGARLLAACRALGPSTAWAMQETDEYADEVTLEEDGPCWSELANYLKKSAVLALTTTALQILITDCIIDPAKVGCSGVLLLTAGWIRAVDEASVALSLYIDCMRRDDVSVALLDPVSLSRRSVT